MLYGCAKHLLPETEVRITWNCWKQTGADTFRSHGMLMALNSYRFVGPPLAFPPYGSIPTCTSVHISAHWKLTPNQLAVILGKRQQGSLNKSLCPVTEQMHPTCYFQKLFLKERKCSPLNAHLFWSTVWQGLCKTQWQQDGFHTLCVHRSCSCSSTSWSAHQACLWSMVHGHTAS